MSVNHGHLLDLAVHDPSGACAELAKLSDAERRKLLEHAASGDVSRRLAAAHGKGDGSVRLLHLVHDRATFHARSSMPALPAFDFHFFRHSDRVWGRTEISVATFLGPGYFGVTEGDVLTFDFDRTPPQDAVPEGWPPVQSNAAALAALLFQGVTIRVHGEAGGLLTGTVWRNGRDQGVFVNLVPAV